MSSDRSSIPPFEQDGALQIPLAANRGIDYLAPSLLHQTTPSEITDYQQPSGYPLRWAGRLLVVVWSLLLTAGLIVAFRLEPDPRGFGTHQQMGFPPCTFRTFFGVSCPSCGMTTSFALFTKGRLFEAARANFAGLLLAICCAVQIPWCWFSAARGRALGIGRPEVVLLWIMLAICSISLAQWLARLVL